ncbi:MAG: 50S ribosomal protein L10 [Elusimicrobiales bacterium]
MKLTKTQKKDKSAKLADELKSASGVFFASYQGLKFVELASLRAKLSPVSAKFRVERNSIMFHAVKGAGFPQSPETAMLKGPTALTLQKGGDLVEAARVLSACEKEFPALKLKACYSADTWYNAAECKKLATLGTRTETIAHLLGSLHGCISQAASVLQAPVRDLAFALEALRVKKSAETPAA